MSDVDLLQAVLPNYEFDEVLGRGAWGVVIAARHRRLNRQVGVKMLPLAFTRDEGVRRRFATEARLLASLDHPHIVRIHDYVEQDDVCALVMERLTGGTLAERMQLGALRPDQATAIALAMLHGLEHAHQQGVLHRDIKPENLMFAADGVLKITDFGIATVLGEQAERLTATGVAMGTPAYMAPEQLEDGHNVGAATDVWAAAAVYYELLTGAVPYPARQTLQATLLARARDEPRPIGSVSTEVPAPIAGAVMRALRREPDGRFRSCAEFAEVLEDSGKKLWGADWLSTGEFPIYRAAPRSVSGAPATAAVLTPRPAGRSTGGRTARERRRVNLIIAGSAAAIVATGTTVAVVTLTGGHSAADHATAGAGGGISWASWNGNNQIAEPAIGTPGLGPVPAGWGDRMTMTLALDASRYPVLGAHFGRGISAEINLGGDPINGPSWDRNTGPHPAADAIRKVESQGSEALVNYYVARIIGRGEGNDASEADVVKQIADRSKMTVYWKDVTELLKELGSLDQPIPLTVDMGVSNTVETVSSDAAKVKAAVASTGVADLAGLPDTFAGWSQAWVKLRDKYAKKVMLGYILEPWAAGDFLVPFGKNYTDGDVVNWAHGFSSYYATLGAKFDFIDYIVAYGEAGKLSTKTASNYPTDKDFARLLSWVTNIAQGTKLRVVLGNVPIGNTVMAPMNNTNYHWQDGYVQWLLGDGDYIHLHALRDAGVIGIDFGFGESGADVTCPCDAANDGETQGVPAGATPTRELAASSDDDGGYLQARISAYLTSGGMPLG